MTTPDPGEMEEVVEAATQAADHDKLGRITWLSSEDGGGPDCGLILGLGEGRSLYVGELANASVADAGLDPKDYPGVGWWCALHAGDGFEIVGPIASSEAARNMADQLFAVLQGLLSRLARQEAEIKALREKCRATKAMAVQFAKALKPTAARAEAAESALASLKGVVGKACDDLDALDSETCDRPAGGFAINIGRALSRALTDLENLSGKGSGKGIAGAESKRREDAPSSAPGSDGGELC